MDSLLKNTLINKLKKCTVIEQVEISGNYRRERGNINANSIDVAIKLLPKNVSRLLRHIAMWGQLSRIGTNHVVIKLNRSLLAKSAKLKLHLYDDSSFGTGLFYTTGPQNHVAAVAHILKKRGMTLTEWGIFYKGDKVDNGLEHNVYELAELPFHPPHMREFGVSNKIDLIKKEHVTATLCRKYEHMPKSIDAAIKSGYQTIIFIPQIAIVRPYLPEYTFYVNELREKYQNKIKIIGGVELDIGYYGEIAPPSKHFKLDVVAATTAVAIRSIPAIRMLQALDTCMAINLITDQCILRKNELFFQWKKLFKIAHSRNITLAINYEHEINLVNKAKMEGCKFLLCGQDPKTIRVAQQSMLMPENLIKH